MTFLTDFLKILKYQISLKSTQWWLRFSMLTDGETDRHEEANSCFLHFCDCTYKWGCMCQVVQEPGS